LATSFQLVRLVGCGLYRDIVVVPLMCWMRRYTSTFTSMLPLYCLSCCWRMDRNLQH